MKIQLKTDCRGITWDAIHDLIKRAGLVSYPPELLARAFQESYAVAFAIRKSQVIGTGRAVSDGPCRAMLYDFAVLPEWQGRGVGRMLMEAILKQVAGRSVMLYASPGKEGFYERFFFRRVQTDMAHVKNRTGMMREGGKPPVDRF